MKLVATLFVSLDGVYQAPGGATEDPRNGFELGGWMVPHADNQFGSFITKVFENVEIFLLGRVTYNIFASHWPKVTDVDDPIATKLNKLQKYVVSSTMTSTDWAHSSIIKGTDLLEEVRRLKALPGDKQVQIHGSGKLVRSLIDAGLVDELHLVQFPVVLGGGFRLFDNGVRAQAFKVVRHQSFDSSGASVLTLAPNGDVVRGNAAIDENGKDTVVATSIQNNKTNDDDAKHQSPHKKRKADE